MLGTERDYCAQAEEVFGGSVPEMLLPEQTEKERATWKEAFGDDAEEVFSAWCFASALEQIASAGRGETSASLPYERMAEAVSVVSGFLSVRRTGRGYAVGMESGGAFTFYHRSGHLCAICL